MWGFELRISCVRSDHLTNCATTAALTYTMFASLVEGSLPIRKLVGRFNSFRVLDLLLFSMFLQWCITEQLPPVEVQRC